MRIIIFLGLLLAAAAISHAVATAPGETPWHFIVTAEEADCDGIPVSVEIPKPTRMESVVLRSEGSSMPIPCQMDRLDGKVRLTWIVNDLKKGQSRSYLAVLSQKPSPNNLKGVDIQFMSGLVEVSVNGKIFTRYYTQDTPRPYFYPVISPTGKGITRAFPMETVKGEPTDHPHHRSLWFAFGSVNGRDFWTDGPKSGKIVHRNVEKMESGSIVGRLRTTSDWIDADGRKVLEDLREFRFYSVPKGQLMDFEITLKATEGPVVLGDTKEGMMAFRVAAPMQVKDGQGHILTSRGDKDANAWGKQAEWCDYSGPLKKDSAEKVGILIFDLPGSFRSPTYWHVRDYGLFAANPFGLKDFTGDKTRDGSHTISTGESVTFRYRIWIHPGDATEAGIANYYSGSIHPPKVTLGPM